MQKVFIECDECRVKPGYPRLCDDCFERRKYFFIHKECKEPKTCTPEITARALAYDEYFEKNAEKYWEGIDYNE